MAEHTFTVRNPAVEGPTGFADNPISPAWAEIDRIREEMLWYRLDTALTANGMGRLFVAGAWMLLALATGARWWWGIGLVIGGALSLLHARRRTVLLIADHAGPLSGLVRWLLPYPRVPHVNPTGMFEAFWAIVANAGTGAIGAAFTTTVSARAAAPVATVLMVLFDLGIVVNMTGHPSWELGPAAPFFVRVRPIISPGCALIALGLLWPASALGPAWSVTFLTLLLGVVGMTVAGHAAQAFLRAASNQMGHRVQAVRRAVQAVDGGYVHQLKNMARIAYRRADEITAGDLRECVRRLCVSISSTEQMFKGGQGQPAQCVEQVMNGLLGIDERFAPLRQVEADLDPRDLTSGDAELITIAVGDLCSNAMNAGAASFRVGLVAEAAEHGSWLTLEAECHCGRTLPEVPEDSSLMRLAMLLHYNRGTFVITDGGGRHRFTLRWPSTSRPRARNPSMSQSGNLAASTPAIPHLEQSQ